MSDELLRKMERENSKEMVLPQRRLADYLRAGNLDEAANAAREVVNGGEYARDAIYALRERPLACTGTAWIIGVTNRISLRLPGRTKSTEVDTDMLKIDADLDHLAYASNKLHILTRSPQSIVRIDFEGNVEKAIIEEPISRILSDEPLAQIRYYHDSQSSRFVNFEHPLVHGFITAFGLNKRTIFTLAGGKVFASQGDQIADLGSFQGVAFYEDGQVFLDYQLDQSRQIPTFPLGSRLHQGRNYTDAPYHLAQFTRGFGKPTLFELPLAALLALEKACQHEGKNV
ncbi:hypothetical protein J4219_07860 [Candidatus Woesearchaeota archaeon]|nr:hypothetical protein [Candidatus Woesearchaeota archaeon]